jgi:hypothetical protein
MLHVLLSLLEVEVTLILVTSTNCKKSQLAESCVPANWRLSLFTQYCIKVNATQQRHPLQTGQNMEVINSTVKYKASDESNYGPPLLKNTS